MSNFIIQNDSQNKLLRGTLYNNTVLLSMNSLRQMVNSFDDFFSNFTDYDTEISCVNFIPIQMFTTGSYYLDPLGRDTTVLCRITSSQALLRLMGEYKIDYTYFNFLDYNPYTKYVLYLPYIGNVDIDNSLYLGKYLRIYLTFDPSSGEAKYMLGYSTRKLNSNNVLSNGMANLIETPQPFYEDFVITNTYAFNIAHTIPLGSSNFSDIIRNSALDVFKSATGLVGSLFLSGGKTTTYTTTRPSISTAGSVSEVRKQTKSHFTTTETETTPRSKGIPDCISSAIDVANSSAINTQCERSSGGVLDLNLSQKPILMKYTKALNNSDNYLKNFSKNFGYLYADYAVLEDIEGFTIISEAHLDNIILDLSRGQNPVNVTEEELLLLRDELLSPNGVILDKTKESPYSIPVLSENILYMGSYFFNDELVVTEGRYANIKFKAKLPYSDDYLTFKRIEYTNEGMFYMLDNKDSTYVKVYDFNEGWNFTRPGDEEFTNFDISRNIEIISGSVDNDTFNFIHTNANYRG